MANLVLNGKSIDTIEEIAENFVEADVLHEYQSGALASWLEEYGYEEELERLLAVVPDADNDRLVSQIVAALGLADDVCKESMRRRQEQVEQEKRQREELEERRRREREDKERQEREETQRLLNMDLEKVSEAKSPQEAFEIYKKAADAGNVHAAAYLARGGLPLGGSGGQE